MASQTSICNMALSRLGTRSTIAAISEQTTEALAASRHWSAAVDSTLRAHDWNFARRRAVLADLGTPPTGWAYRYAYPSDCLRALEIVRPIKNADPIPFEVAGDDDANNAPIRIVLTNEAQATLKYTKRVISTDAFDPDFVTALSWRLAADMAMALTGKADIFNAMMNGFGVSLQEAQASDGNEGTSPQNDQIAPWLAARGYNGEDGPGYTRASAT